jgi:hypothetical protein
MTVHIGAAAGVLAVVVLTLGTAAPSRGQRGGAQVWDGRILPARAVDCDAANLDEQVTLLCLMDLAKELEAHPENFRIDEDRIEAVDRTSREICAGLEANRDSEAMRSIMQACALFLPPQ